MHFEYIQVWVITLLIFLILNQNTDGDDDDEGGGLMQPAYEGR